MIVSFIHLIGGPTLWQAFAGSGIQQRAGQTWPLPHVNFAGMEMSPPQWKKKSFGCESKWNLVSRAELLASSLNFKVGSWIERWSQLQLSFSFWLPWAYAARKWMCPFISQGMSKSSQNNGKDGTSDLTFLWHTKLPSRQEKLSCFFFFFFEGKTVNITLVLFRLWNPKLIPMKILGWGAHVDCFSLVTFFLEGQTKEW